MDECKPLTNGGCDTATVCVNVPGAVECGQVDTLVHISAQPEPFLTENTPETSPNIP